jgi:hypothetical protein
VSPYNSLGDGRYYDVESQSSYQFDHETGKASDVRSYVLESEHEELVYVYPQPMSSFLFSPSPFSPCPHLPQAMI